jgi:hypothetical protein
MAERDGREILTLVVAYVITALWAAGFLLDVFMPRYDPPAGSTPLMLSVAGYCFASDAIHKIRRNGHDQ